MKSKDLQQIIHGWPHDPGRVTVRRVVGDDDRLKIQMRVDLGLLQMETDGRPDGNRPFEHESLLEYHREALSDHFRRNGTELGFALMPDDCQDLRDESLQYYQRYLANFALEDYSAVVRDTQRNLDVLDFCSKFAMEESDRYALEVYRPYIVMMNARAKALRSMNRGSYLAALAHVEKGVEAIREFFRSIGSKKRFRQSPEVAVLRALRKDIRRKLPTDPIRKLKQKIADAVAEERFEDAVVLRDELRSMLECPEESGADA
jgi:hypothetical protein